MRVGDHNQCRVVGLALRVAQLELFSAHVDDVVMAVSDVGVAVLSRPAQVRRSELSLIDNGVVAVREDVAVKARREMLVRDHLRRRPAPFCRFRLEIGDAEDVVDVTMRIDRRVEGTRRPRTERVVHRLREELRARVH